MSALDQSGLQVAWRSRRDQILASRSQWESPAASIAVPNREGLSVTLPARQSHTDRHTARMTFVVHIAVATSGRFNNPA